MPDNEVLFLKFDSHCNISTEIHTGNEHGSYRYDVAKWIQINQKQRVEI